MKYQTYDNDSSIHTIYCDICKTNFATERPNAMGTPTNNLPEDAITIGEYPSEIHICPSCRYKGATVQTLQWTLHPDKYSVDIIGALKSTTRIMGNIRQYLGDIKVLFNPSYDTKDREKKIFQTLTNIENLTNMAESNDNVAIAELLEFGKH